MDIMVAEDVLLVMPEQLLLHLERGVVDALLPADVRQLLQHLPLHAGLREHMGDEDGLAWPQVPDVQVVHVHHPIQLPDLLLQLLGVDVARGRLHDDEVAVLQNGEGRDEDQDGEDVRSDGVAVMPVIPFGDFLALVRAGEEDDERRDDQPNALDDVG